MAEVRLPAFPRTALEVSRAVLPPYRTRFSKHQFTLPQLLAILCLMRYEDWTFREAEVRLSEHREWRQTLGLPSVPDFTTLYRFLQRLDCANLDRAVDEMVRRMQAGRGHGHRRARVAVDATGYPPTARGPERDPSHAREENVARASSACRNAPGVSAQALPAPCPDRNAVLLRETEAVGPGARSLASDADASSPAARAEFQLVPPEASPLLAENVNRAK
jgi:hypothetical protein